MASLDNPKLHVVVLPYFGPSHVVPLVDAARLIAAQGVKVSILSTKYNLLPRQSAIDHDIELGHDISVHYLKFPSAEVGLPEGVEDAGTTATLETFVKIYQALMLLQKPIEKLVQHLKPHCIISDGHYFRISDFARRLALKKPTVLFCPESVNSYCLRHNLWLYEPHKSVKSDSETFLIPGLPDEIEMKRSQLEDFMMDDTKAKPFKEFESGSIGLLFNSFYEFESQYVDYYKKAKGTNVWTIGPLHYFSNKEMTDNQNPPPAHHSLNWLDTKGKNQVLYISFGSLVSFSAAQLKEIALALEASNQSFIWVLRKRENDVQDDQDNNQQQISCWLDDFEERVTERDQGLIIRDWAPQLKILNHPSIGGFLMHCGWNSTMEAVIPGVPLITWPVLAENFYTEKLFEVLKVGVRVGADHWNMCPTNTGPLLESKQIEEAIRRVMGDTEESQEIRKKAKEMAVFAKRAVEEGGSSYQNLLGLIDTFKSSAFGVKN